MSRIGKQPIDVPDKVEVTLDGLNVKVKGPLGELAREFRPEVEISREGNVIWVKPTAETRQARALHGLSRTLLANMVEGVSKGFTKNMEMVGVGYRARVEGNKLILSLGYSHPVEIDLPAGTKVDVKDNTKLTVTGHDKEVLGDLCAEIRSWRPPEPYKGKGIKFAGERIIRKAGKAGKK
jgi:large subunit ribosomal protein L6